MYASVLPSDADRPGLPGRAASVPGFLRTNSEVRVGFARTARGTAASELYETGGLRLRFPNTGGGCDGVLINTAGGITGGDLCRIGCTLGPRAATTLTSQSAEKIYRAEAEPAKVRVGLSLGDKASLAWIPQETILFDGARLERTLDADMAASARLTVLEMVVFGRVASGERLASGLVHDHWRVRRGGRLVLAEDVRLEGNISEILQRRATGGGARAVATLVHVAECAEERLAAARKGLAKARSECGASAWNGLLVQRFASAEPAHLRADVSAALTRLLRGPLPRVWSC